MVIGVGSSAGGLEALRSLFSSLNSPLGASFVVVQHVSPQHRSMLAGLLSRDTSLEVVEIVDKTEIKKDVIYVTPPNKDVSISEDGVLRTYEPEGRIGPKPSIDNFFISLADAFQENCGGIILSGTGSDGSHGVRAIKSGGGFVIAQDPKSAKYDGMPLASINTGAVDVTLSPAEIGEKLPSLIEHLHSTDQNTEESLSVEPVRGILELVKRRKKVNFLQYKPNTLHRRIQRRMSIHKVIDPKDYLEILKKEPKEIDKLFQSILITVTEFFRDKEQYEKLRACLRECITQKRSDEVIRVWSAGCSTGEEAYSLAIIIDQILEEQSKDLNVQIFATDINEEAMHKGRKAVFSETALQSVPPNILKKYFMKLDGHYQIKKHLRERIVFAKHDLTQDPPFLKMDLICCRNVFIYFSSEIQDKVLKLFHYSLNPNGILFLGRSETIGSTKKHFENVDQAAKIYRRNTRAPDPSLSFTKLPAQRGKRSSHSSPIPSSSKPDMTELVESIAPDSLVLDEDLFIKRVYGRAKRYLIFPDGELSGKLERLIHPDLKNKVSTLLHRAKRSGVITRGNNYPVLLSQKEELVDLIVYPLTWREEHRLLVSFFPLKSKSVKARSSSEIDDKEFEELERELTATREHLQSVIEEQETSNEELQALNEELHSANEELQSTNEELETSNEELQSSNEELTTLNEEVTAKSDELIQMNNYLDSVIRAINQPLVIVDENLNLSRYDRAASEVLNLKESHLGKNIELANYSDELTPVIDFLKSCLKKGTSGSFQIKSDKRDFQVTVDLIEDARKKIKGAVLSLVENTKIFESIRKIETSEKRLRSIFENTLAVVSLKDIKGRYLYVNPRFLKIFNLKKDEVIGKTDADLFEPKVAKAVQARDREVLRFLKPMRTQESFFYDGSKHYFINKRFPLSGLDGVEDSVCSIAVDITEQVKASQQLELFKEIVSASNDGLLILEEDKEANDFVVSFASPSLQEQFSISSDRLHGNSLAKVISLFKTNLDPNELSHMIVNNESRVFEFSQGSGDNEKWFELHRSLFSEHEKRVLFLILFDITDRKRNQMLLHQKQEELLKAGKLASLGEMAAGIAHELKTPLNVITGHIDILNMASPSSPEFPGIYKESIGAIDNTIQKISDVISGLKSLSRIEGTGASQEIDVSELIKNIVNSFSLSLGHKDISIRYEKPDRPVTIKCFRTQIEQVLINLISNAADAVGQLKERWIEVQIKCEDQDCIIQVIDSGSGLSPQVEANLFTPFFTTKKSGTGLGLSLSRSIVKEHQGSLRVNHNMKNTCFEVTLPLASQSMER